MYFLFYHGVPDFSWTSLVAPGTKILRTRGLVYLIDSWSTFPCFDLAGTGTVGFVSRTFHIVSSTAGLAGLARVLGNSCYLRMRIVSCSEIWMERSRSDVLFIGSVVWEYVADRGCVIDSGPGNNFANRICYREFLVIWRFRKTSFLFSALFTNLFNFFVLNALWSIYWIYILFLPTTFH
jgi:hypothetical protein